MGLHCFGFVADTDEAAADTFYPGWQEMSSWISRERGGAPPTRAQFDATTAPEGAFLVGSPVTVADKVRRIADDLGGVERMSIQMTNPRLRHEDLLHSIELLGTEVAGRVGHG